MTMRQTQRLANAARRAIRHGGVDPLLALSYVVWPTKDIQTAAKAHR